jgi:putative endonuclease
VEAEVAVYDVVRAFARAREWVVGRWGRARGRPGWPGRPGRSDAAPPPHLALGQFGEHLAARRLRSEGYRLVATNFTAPIGRRRDQRLVTGEIDIIAYDEKTDPPTLVFAEVKTRSSAEWALPAAAVNRRKQRQIIRTARVYRHLLRVTDEPYRYDVIGILAAPGQRTLIEILPAYFDEGVFRHSRWLDREGRKIGFFPRD